MFYSFKFIYLYNVEFILITKNKNKNHYPLQLIFSQINITIQ